MTLKNDLLDARSKKHYFCQGISAILRSKVTHITA